MPLVNFSNLDFDQIKTSIKDYLRANSNFTDYDFEGSNLSTIIDTLAYNTYITSYNANMVTNEVFIDSATLRENVVSLARNIGYVPKSKKSSTANVAFSVDVSNNTSITVTLKAGISFISSNNYGTESYVFSVPNDVTVPVDSNGVATFDDVKIYEGTYISQNYTVSSRTPNQKFILPNTGIDADLINVSVRDSEQSSVIRKFSKSDGLFEIDSTSLVYFLNEISNERYEIIFGDGLFGTKLQEPNYIEINYIICNGLEANNIDNFAFSGSLIDDTGKSITTGISLVSTILPSYGGNSIEDVESIKKYSTQIYSSQNRAVTASDYEAIVPRIYPETESVAAYGGEDLVPPQYGKVFVAIKPENGVYLSSSIKENVQRKLRKYSVAGIISEIVDLKYLYLEVNSNVYYNTNLTNSPPNTKSIILENIINYSNSTQLNKFGARFKYSKFLKIIDDGHESITSNITTVVMRRDLRPVLNSFAEYEICYGNRFYISGDDGFNIKSSGFTVSGISETVYIGDIPDKNLKTGKICLFKLNALTESVIVKNSIGTIDYIKGEIMIQPINILSTVVNRGAPLIEISISPYSNDVIGLQDLYLQLDTSNTNVSMIPDNIASGDDISGSNYNVTSSYSNGSLTR
tara:strand:+ start:2037 stop:3938 length:1902 start_codon:yes stop_codon:yes gene_type:complete